MSATREQIEAALRGPAAELLGDIFAWSVESATSALTPNELRRRFEAAGLDVSRLPRDASATSAIRSAVREVCKAHGAEVKILRENPAGIMWAVVDSTVDENTPIGGAVGSLANRVLWDNEREELFFKVETELTRAVEASFAAKIGSLTWKATRDTIVRYLRGWGAFRLWGTGGVYFVPAEFTAEVRKLAEVVGTLGECGVIPVPKVADSERSIGVAARRHVAEEIARARREVEKWQAEGHVPRDSTIEARLADVYDLRSELSAFAAGLQAQTADLEGEISALVAATKALVVGSLAAGEPDAPAKGPTGPEEPSAAEPGAETPAEESGAHAAPEGVSEVEPEEQVEPEPSPAPAPPAAPRPPARPVTPRTSPREAKRVELEGLTVRKLRTLARGEGVDPRGLDRAELVEILVAGV